MGDDRIFRIPPNTSKKNNPVAFEGDRTISGATGFWRFSVGLPHKKQSGPIHVAGKLRVCWGFLARQVHGLLAGHRKGFVSRETSSQPRLLSHGMPLESDAFA